MLIEEIMKRDVIALSPHHTVKDALSIMQEKKIRHLPIVSETKELLGIITDRDLKEVLPSLYSDTTDVTVYKKPLSEIMTSNPIIGHPMDFVEEAAVVFYDNQIGCLPIVSNNKLVGILTETDLLYKYIELTGAHQPGSQIEVRVPNIPGILYEVSKVFYQHKLNVQSVLVYPDKENEDNKILVIRLRTMNPLNVIKGLRNSGFEVLWPNVPGIDL
ncbi:acetoin utilization AcuB family protein [Sporosarcina highlanderae]|uniref:Acetoin utilization AcuB family protein n=1 Tax=Sporosarcina highlanderae TaxID=3035916 RepID=A0ABT8JPD5_9BACL|nr:acetoin utilization AcuB family protein [Sporosarcina highlanderae]MDN4606995.1 acetoin utilization AcuB family protein [Sporosarcina highlanderae]